MFIWGKYVQAERGAFEPRVQAYLPTATGLWHRFEFLIDSGSDHTFLPPDGAKTLRINLSALRTSDDAGGVGSNRLVYYKFDTELRFLMGGHMRPVPVTIGIFQDEGLLDLPVLGRDVLDQFALVLDRSRNLVALIDPSQPNQIAQWMVNHWLRNG